jgi:putative polyhydroxyalkanoate system protein
VPDIRIQRAHRLGLPKAREIAWKWAEEVETKFSMECTVYEGDDCDMLEFKRSGVNGTLRVAADSFELDAKLGFLLGAFSRTIETEIEKNLDDLLNSSTAIAKKAPARKAAPSVKAAAKPAAKPAVKRTARK